METMTINEVQECQVRPEDLDLEDLATGELHYLPEDSEQQRWTGRIENDEHAEWLLRKLANADAEIARVQAQANDIVHGLRARQNRLKALFEDSLREYCALKLEAQKGKSKTIKFLQGSCSFRTVPARLSVADPEAAIAWLDDHDEEFQRCVEVVAKLRSADYLALVEETGELLPGVEPVPERQSFSIRFPKGGEQ